MKTSIPKKVENAFCTLYEGLIRNSKYSGNWAIIETNYKHFLIVYSCNNSPNESVYILTRSPDPDPMDQLTINNVLESNFGKDYESKLNLHNVYQN